MRAVVFMVAFALLGCVSAARAAAAEGPSSDESLVAERLSSRALAVLDGMFGAGHAKLLVEVRGERLQIKTETEILTPMNKDGSVKEALRLLDLPGYYKDKPPPPPEKNAPPTIQPYQKDFEHSLRDAGFEIKKIEATVVLDAALTETEARDAAQILPQLLRIDATRGDMLSIVRAPMRPAWKAAFSTPADWRKLAFAATGLIGALIVVMILSSAFVRGARVFAKELTAHREPQPGLGNDGAGEPLPELVPGALGGMLEEGAGGEGGAISTTALGRRFDFLDTADAVNAARILASEPPSDLAQVFAYLAKLAPETASKLFSKLPPAVQAEASAAILKMTTADPDRLNDIEERLKDLVANGLQGSQRLATILSRFTGDERAMLLSRLASLDSRSVQEIENQLVSFEDFEALSPADLRRIMGAVPYELWGTALRGASQSFVNRVLSELPDGPRDLIREQVAAPQPKDKVVAARSKLLDAYLDLASKGQITLEQGAGAEETL